MGKTGDLGVKNNKETYIFFKTTIFSICPGRKSRTKNCIFLKRGVFWSGLRRNSRVAKSEKWEGGGWGRGAFARHIPVLSLYGSTPPPGLGFCNFRLENEFRTNFKPILTKCWVKFFKIGNAIKVFTIF